MKLHLPKLLLTAVVAAMGVQYAYAADDATYELTFGNGATLKSANVIQLATDYYLKTQDAGNATNYYVGLSTSGDPNNSRPSDAGVPVVTAREGGGWILTAPEAATNGKVYTWITRDANGTSSANTAVPGQTTFAIGYDGTNSYVNVLNTSGNDAYVQMKGNQFDWSQMSLIKDVGLTNVSLNIKTGILEYKSWISNYDVAAGAILTTSATIDANSCTLTFAEGAKLVVNALELDDSVNYEVEASGVQEIAASKQVFSNYSEETGIAQVYLGSAGGRGVEVKEDGSINVGLKVYVVANDDTVTINSATDPESLGSPDMFALSDSATLAVAGDLDTKSATTVVEETIGTGTIDVQCAIGSLASLNSGFTGSLMVSNGGSISLSSTGSITNFTVGGTGSQLEVGSSLAGADITLGAGGTLIKSTTDNWANVDQIHEVTLTGDASIVANKAMGLVSMTGNTYSSTTLNLNGYTLTKSGGGNLALVDTTVVGGGTIDLTAGNLLIGHANKASTISATGTKMKLSGTGTVKIEKSESTLQIDGLTGTGGILYCTGTVELGGSSEYSFAAQVTETTGKIKITGSGTHTYTGSSIENAVDVENASGTFKFASDAAQTVSGAISGAGKLSKSGAGTVTASGDASGFNGTMEVAGGTMSFTKDGGAVDVSKGLTLSGGQLKVTGTLTLSSEKVTISNLETYFSMATDLSVDLITAGSISGWAGETSVGTYISDGTQYTTTVSQQDNKLVLTFAAPTADEPFDFTVDRASLTGTVLTLNINADLTDGSSVDLILSDAALADIKDMTGLVDLSLVFNNGTYTSVAGQENSLAVSFYDGAYKGEADGKYNVQYIPEPATATLSLLALAGLAARRRRKA